MLNSCQALFSPELLALQQRFLWSTALIGLTADALIALACYSISIALLYAACQQKTRAFRGLLVLPGALAAACGTIHLLEIWAVWGSGDRLLVSVKAIAALISVLTAIQFIPLVPQGLALLNAPQLRKATWKTRRQLTVMTDILNGVQNAARNLKQNRLHECQHVEDERQQTEAALRQSERTNQALIRAIPDLLIQIRQDGTYLRVERNEAFRLFEPEASVPGANIYDIMPLENARQRMQSIQQALSTEELQIYEHQITVDGEILHEETRIVPLSDSEVLVIVRDITDRKQAEQALRESEERFRKLINDLHVGVIVYDAQAEVVLSNSKALSLLGLAETQPPGSTPLGWDAVYEDDSPLPWEAHPVLQAIASRRSVQNVIMGIRSPSPDDRVWLLVDAEPQFDQAGQVQQVICTFSDISDRQAALREQKRTEAELQQREQAFRALVENAPDIIMRLDQDCRYLYINPTVERQSGVPAAAFINKTIQEFGAPEALTELWRINIQKAFATGQEQKLEFETATPTGTAYYATRVVPEFADDGSVQSVLAIARDISDYMQILREREQAEEALRQSEARLRLALKAARFGTWEYNFVTKELIQNGISEIYGLEPGQTHRTYEEWQAQTHPDDRQQVQQEFKHAVQTSGEFNVEFRIIRPDGQIRWTFSAGAVVHNSAGQPLYSYGFVADITDRKLAEVELKAQQAFLHQVIDVVPNIIFVKDRTGHILIVNQAGAIAHGTTVEAMLGRRETDFNPNFSPKQLQEFLSINQQVMQTRQSHTSLSQSIVSTTGETRWYQTVINPLIDVNGQIQGIVGATTDITELKHIEQAVQQAKEAAEASNKAKSLFLANMSHELRTPLNVILGFVQVMNRDPRLTPEHHENLQIIRRSGDHLLNLINDVLDLSKIEAGHATLDESSIDLIDLLWSLEQMFHQRAEAKGLELRFDLAPDLPQYVITDANKLRQILINLLGNAIKFTPRGIVALQVKPERSAAPQPLGSNGSPTVCFKVSDTGVGITASELETIFQAFVQSRIGKMAPDGTGLGLTISRKFIQMMGGDIAVQSQLGQGSTFTFTLPFQLARSSDIATADCHVSGLAPNQPTYRILVVDDQPENRKLLVNLLTLIGLQVREAANGQEAVMQWQQWSPDLIWMDIRMPVMDGYEATQQIRAMPRGEKTIVIALTAQASVADRTLALAAGCNDYLSKPFQEEILFNKMAEHLGLKYLYTEAQFTPAHPASLHSPISLQSFDLEVMPSTWIAALHQAARLCDDNEAEQLIQQIPVEHKILMQGLHQLVQNYKFKQIIDLTTGSIDVDA